MCTGDCGDAVTLSYINLLTGVQTSVAPDGFQAYNCDAVPQYSQKCVPYLETETFDASAGQTVFTIAHAASGDVRFSRNGATLHDAAAVVSGSVVTYVPGPNNAEVLLANDRIEISYLYVVCEDSLPVDYVLKDCIGNELPSGTEFVTCAALDSEDFTIEANGNIKINSGGQALEDCKGAVLPNGTSVLKCDALDPDTFVIDPATGIVDIKDSSKGQGLKDCKGTLLPSGTSVLRCDALNPDHFEIDPATGEISSKCCVEPDVITCYSKPAIVESAIASTVTTFNTNQGALNGANDGPQILNLNYEPSGQEEDGEYAYGANSSNHTAGGGFGIEINFALGVPPVPFIFYRQTFKNLTPGLSVKLSDWVKSRAGNSQFGYKIYNAGTGALILDYSKPAFASSAGWQNHLSDAFVIPASGQVRIEFYNLIAGSASGNDPVFDDISLIQQGQQGACYKKVISGGVETWYDGAGQVISNQTTINSIKAEISAGTVNVSDCNVCYGTAGTIVAGTGIRITGSGTVADPYVISLA
jgi:hypothetical protein